MNVDQHSATVPGLVSGTEPAPAAMIPAPPGAAAGSAMIASDSPGSRLLAQAMGNTAVCTRLLAIVVVFAAVLAALALLAPAVVSVVGSILTVASSGPPALRAWRASHPRPQDTERDAGR